MISCTSSISRSSRSGSNLRSCHQRKHPGGRALKPRVHEPQRRRRSRCGTGGLVTANKSGNQRRWRRYKYLTLPPCCFGISCACSEQLAVGTPIGQTCQVSIQQHAQVQGNIGASSCVGSPCCKNRQFVAAHPLSKPAGLCSLGLQSTDATDPSPFLITAAELHKGRANKWHSLHISSLGQGEEALLQQAHHGAQRGAVNI